MLLESLKILINQAETEGWNDNELYHVLEEFVEDYYCNEVGDDADDYFESDHINLLADWIKPWSLPSDLPQLPLPGANISLHGVGVIYYKDTDDRVLLAIQQLLLFEANQLKLIEANYQEIEAFSALSPTQLILEELTKDIELICDRTTRIVAVLAHDSLLHVYCREPAEQKLNKIELCNDEWEIVYYYPVNRMWIDRKDS